MAKIHVLDSEGAEVPFLRGILTHSLQQTGLSFEDAYAIASAVRDELAARGKSVDSTALPALVSKHLEPLGKDAVTAFANRRRVDPLQILCNEGEHTPFSRGRFALGLQACGIGVEDAARLSHGIHADLIEKGRHEIPSLELQRLTYETLKRDVGEQTAHRYLVWQGFKHSERPLFVLIGGTDGVGKSTTATQLASTLEIMRTQSTDLLREVMRVMIPEPLMPFLHTSSFKAWQKLPTSERPTSERPTSEQLDHLPEGYLTQAELLSVACGATIQRAQKERVSLVLEGVHVHPVLQKHLPKEKDAVVVFAMLAVLKAKDLRQRLQRRRVVRGPHHLKNFDAIWRLQGFLLAEADRSGIPIVVNEDPDRTVQALACMIVDRLAESFEGSPESVFGS